MTHIARPVRRGSGMNASLITLGVVLVVLVGVAWVRGGLPLAADGLNSGMRLLLAVAPQLVIGFALAGMVTVLVPSEVLSRYVGGDSGLIGILLATAAGIATPGGPFVQFPLVAALARAGVGPGPMAAYLTAWSLLGWQRILVYELPLLGAPFTISRAIVSLVLPVAVGLLVPLLLRAAAPVR